MLLFNAIFLVLLRKFWLWSKVKAVPLESRRGPQGFRKLRFTDFVTAPVRMVVGCQPYAPATFTPWKYSWHSFLLDPSRPQGHSAIGSILCQWHQLGSNQRPSDLLHSTLTTVLFICIVTHDYRRILVTRLINHLCLNFVSLLQYS